MSDINNKHRLQIWIDENSYAELYKTCKTNKLLTGRLTAGVLVEIALRLFFKEIRNGKSISKLMIETGIIGEWWIINEYTKNKEVKRV